MVALRQEPNELVALIRSRPPFRDLDGDAVAALVRLGRPMDLQPGDVLMRHGDDSDCAYVIVEGTAEIRIDTVYGPVPLAVVSAPSFVGEVGVFTGVPRTATLFATKPLRVLRIAADDLRRFGESHPRFLSAVLAQLGGRFQAFNRAIGFYTHALTALRQDDFDLRLLDDLKFPAPELADFSESFRRLAEEIVLRREQREDMANAAAIQRAMLPTLLSPDGGDKRVDIFARMLPAREVGGDFYDFFFIDSDRLAVTIGDVSGKGTPASLFMAASQTALRLALRLQPELEAAVKSANDLLVAGNKEAMFTTLFCAVLDLGTGVLTVCNCGHPAALLIRRSGTLERIATSNAPLGLRAVTRYKTVTMHLAAGDLLFLHTDGLTDAHDTRGETYGDERLEASVRAQDRQGPENAVNGVLAAIEVFARDAPRFDDLTGLALVFHGHEAAVA